MRRAKLGAVHSGVHPPSRPKRAAHSRRQLPLRPAHRPVRVCLATNFVPVSGECDDDNMAPNKPYDSAEHAQEHEEFLDTLEKYHEKRG
jgi:hypothetical protein